MLIDRIKRIAIAAFLAFFVGYSLHLFIARNKAEKELAIATAERDKAVAEAIANKQLALELTAKIEQLQSAYNASTASMNSALNAQKEMLNKQQQDCVKGMQKLKDALAKEHDNARIAVAALQSSIKQYEAMLSAITDALIAERARADYAENLYALQRVEMQKALDLLSEIEYSLREKENAN